VSVFTAVIGLLKTAQNSPDNLSTCLSSCKQSSSLILFIKLDVSGVYNVAVLCEV